MLILLNLEMTKPLPLLYRNAAPQSGWSKGMPVPNAAFSSGPVQQHTEALFKMEMKEGLQSKGVLQGYTNWIVTATGEKCNICAIFHANEVFRSLSKSETY